MRIRDWSSDVCSSDMGPASRPGYDARTLCFNNILRCIENSFPPDDAPLAFDLPAFAKPQGLGRYAVIRPPTLRRDFYGPARTPRPEYVMRAAELLRRQGFATVAVAHVRPGLEWHEGAPPAVDHDFTAGQLSVPDPLGLVAGASLVVGGQI